MKIVQGRKKSKSRRPPFYGTLKQLTEVGIRTTLYMLITLLMRHMLPSTKIKYVFYKFFSNKTIVVDIYGSKMWLNLADKGICHELLLYRKREPIFTDYLIKFGVLKEGDVVLDIGANIGYYALIESRLVGNSGKVYAIEPVSRNYQTLKRNVKLNARKNVDIFRLAVGDKDGKSRIYVSDKSNLSAMERISGGDLVGVEEVVVVTVDSFLKDKPIPNLIRMDVEGYEYYILKGMTKTLKENKKIMMELHPPLLPKEKLEEMIQMLKENNYQIQFFVIEHNVNEHKIVKYLMRKGGDNLPVIAFKLTIDELIRLIRANPQASPHILFSKTK